MRTCVIFCAVIALCALHATNAQTIGSIKVSVQRLKSRAEAVVSKLERYQRDVTFNLDTKLHRSSISAMEQVNGIVNPALQQVRNAIEAAKKEGRNAEHCYEPVRLALRPLSQNAFDGIKQCTNDAKKMLDPVLNNVKATIQAGRDTVSYIDSIMTSCYSFDTIRMINCISGKLPGASSTVSSLEATADSVKQSGDSVSNSAYNQAIRCYPEQLTALRRETPVEVAKGVQCTKQ